MDGEEISHASVRGDSHKKFFFLEDKDGELKLEWGFLIVIPIWTNKSATSETKQVNRLWKQGGRRIAKGLVD
jgi:hypothetical protein